MTIQCIAFDLDDTFWDCDSIIRRAENNAYQWLQHHYPLITNYYPLPELIRHRLNFMGTRPDLNYNLGALRRLWLAKLADEFNYSRALVEPAFMTFWLARNQVEFYPGVLEVLPRLAQRFKLGVISNGNADVHHIGIGRHFTFTYSSAEAGMAKPQAGIFLNAFAKSGLAPEQVIYVGDDLEKDVAGAANVGCKTIWFKHPQVPASELIQPDEQIQHFNQLESAIEALT